MVELLTRLVATRCSDDERDRGLIAYLELTVLGVLRVDGVTIRRRRDGARTLSWPGRRDGSGRLHEHVFPATAKIKSALTQEIFEELDRQGVQL